MLMELHSLIKGNGHYLVYGVYFPTEKGRDIVQQNGDILLPQSHDTCKSLQLTPSHSRCIEAMEKCGKGSHPPDCSKMPLGNREWETHSKQAKLSFSWRLH